VFDGPNDFYDDPLAGYEMVDRRTAIAYFEIRAQDFLRDEEGLVFFFDDGFFDDPVLGYPEPIASFPPAILSALLGIISDVAAKKAGGVNFDLFLSTDVRFLSRGTTTSGSFT